MEDQTLQAPQNNKVLCVEDERFISDLYKRALEKAGFVVTVVADGVEGLAEAGSDKYDIVLLDIMLPNMNGVEMLGKLKGPEAERPLHGKVIITTNLDQKEEVRKQVEQLADGYLIKAEVTPKEMVKYVLQVAHQQA